MADPIINVLIRAKLELKDALEQFRRQIQGVNSSVDGIGKDSAGLEGLKKALQSAGDQTKRTAKDLESISDQLLSMTDAVPKLIDTFKGLGAVLLGTGTAAYLKSTADAAARTEVLGTVMGVVAKNAGYTKEQLDRVDRSVQKMGITASSSRQSLVTFMQAGLDVNKAAEMARAAQDLAVVSGENSSETFQRMITNIQQLDTLGMRFMGIIIDADTAYQQYAKSIGKVASELSQSEKQQAFMNAALNESIKLSGTYEAAMGNVAKQVQSLARLKENLAVSIGNNLLPAYSALVEEFSDFLKQAGLMVDSEEGQAKAAREFGESIRQAANYVKEATLILVEHKDIILTVLKFYIEFKLVNLIFKTLVGSVDGLSKMLGKLPAAMTQFGVVGTAESGKVALKIGEIQGMLTKLAGWLSKGLYIAISWEVGRNFGEWLNQFTTVKNAAYLMVEGVMDTINQVTDTTKTLGTVLLSPFKALASGTKKPLEDAYKEMEGFGQRSMDRIKEIVDASYALITGKDRDSAARAKEWAAKFDETRKQVKESYVEQYSLEKQIQDLSIRTKQAEASGDLDVANRLKEQSAELQKKYDKQQKVLDSKVKEKNLAASVVESIKEEAQAESVLLEKRVSQDQILKDLNDSMKTLGVETKITTGEMSVTVSESFAKMTGAFEKVKQALEGSLDITQAKQKMLGGVKEMQMSMTALASSAKTPEEIAAAIAKIDSVGGMAANMAKSLRENLNMKFEKSTIDELNAAVEGLVSSQQQLRSVLEQVKGLEKDNQDAQEKLAKTILEITGSTDAAKNGIMELGQQLKATGRDGESFKLSMNLNALTEQVQKAKASYDQDMRNLEAVVNRKSAIILEGLQDEKTTRAKLMVLDKETTDQRIQLAKTYYDKLKSVRDQALDLWKEYASKVKALDQELLDLRKSKEETLNDIRRKGMTQDEQLVDKRREADELESKSRAANLTGDFEKAKEYASKRIALEKDIASAVQEGSVPDTAKLESAYDQLESVVKRQRTEAVNAADEQKKAYKEVADQLLKMSSVLNDSLKEKTAQLEVQINLDPAKKQIQDFAAEMQNNPLMVAVTATEDSIRTMVQKITDAINSVKATVDVGVSVSKGYATGGFISGPGTETSDSILARLSSGEFVVRAAAVRRYGLGFMEALNGMALPRLRIPAFATGGPVGDTGSSRDSVDVNLTLNGEKITLQGSRQQVKKFTKAVQSVGKASV